MVPLVTKETKAILVQQVKQDFQEIMESQAVEANLDLMVQLERKDQQERKDQKAQQDM